MRNCGIASQFERSVEVMQRKPDWAADGRPFVQKLKPPSEAVRDVIPRLCKESFESEQPWQFDSVKHLAEAEVGAAIGLMP